MNTSKHVRSPGGITVAIDHGRAPRSISAKGRVARRRGRSVLFPTDYSPTSHHAFELASRLAQGGAGQLTLLHAADPAHVPSLGMAAGSPLPAGHRGAWESRLRMARPPDPSLRFDHRVEEGDPADAVLRVARQADSDLIVMGARRRTVLDRLLGRGVSDRVAARAPCPVLTLTPGADGAVGSAGVLPGAGGTILHPTDFSPPALYALDLARDLARASGCWLLVFHVAPIRLYREPGHRREAEEALDRLVAASSGVLARRLLLPGDPATQAVSTATQLDCGLIVMGTAGRTGFDWLMQGSVAGAVQGRSRCPVLTARLPGGGRRAEPGLADEKADAVARTPEASRHRRPSKEDRDAATVL